MLNVKGDETCCCLARRSLSSRCLARDSLVKLHLCTSSSVVAVCCTETVCCTVAVYYTATVCYTVSCAILYHVLGVQRQCAIHWQSAGCTLAECCTEATHLKYELHLGLGEGDAEASKAFIRCGLGIRCAGLASLESSNAYNHTPTLNTEPCYPIPAPCVAHTRSLQPWHMPVKHIVLTVTFGSTFHCTSHCDEIRWR